MLDRKKERKREKRQKMAISTVPNRRKQDGRWPPFRAFTAEAINAHPNDKRPMERARAKGRPPHPATIITRENKRKAEIAKRIAEVSLNLNLWWMKDETAM